MGSDNNSADNNEEPTTSTVPLVIVDPHNLPGGYIHGEETMSLSSGEQEQLSSSSSSDDESRPDILPPSRRTTRVSARLHNTSEVSTKSITGPETVTSLSEFQRLMALSEEDTKPEVSLPVANDNSDTHLEFSFPGSKPFVNLDSPPNNATDFVKSLLPDKKVNYRLHQTYQQRGKDGYLDTKLDTKEKHQLALLKLCLDAKVPNYLYDELLRWAEDAHADGYFNRRGHQKRQLFITHMSKRVFLQDFFPLKSTVHLPNAGIDLSITLFSAEQAILSLLMDKELMKLSLIHI